MNKVLVHFSGVAGLYVWNKLVVFCFCLLRIKFDYTLYCKVWFLLIISFSESVSPSVMSES